MGEDGGEVNPVLAFILCMALIVVACTPNWMSDAIYEKGKAAYERENPE